MYLCLYVYVCLHTYQMVRGLKECAQLTDLLTGFDVIVNGTVVESWASMLPQWSTYLEWAVANRINQVSE